MLYCKWKCMEDPPHEGHVVDRKTFSVSCSVCIVTQVVCMVPLTPGLQFGSGPRHVSTYITLGTAPLLFPWKVTCSRVMYMY